MKRFLEGSRANVKGSPSGRLRFLLNNTRVTASKSLKRDKKHPAHDQVMWRREGNGIDIIVRYSRRTTM